MRTVAIIVFRAVVRVLRAIHRFVYRLIAALFAKISFAARVVAVLSPHFFLVYRGDALAPVTLTPEFHALRVLMGIAMSFLFFSYFVWDALVVAGRASKKHPHISGTDWDRAKAAMDDDDPSMMGTTAWMKRRARQDAS